jgi:NAD(P)-dependent dehydrogenase (short-subunit alcohol dehydrogenase family)
MTQGLLDQPQVRRHLEAQIPQRTIGTVADVASAVWFLCSSEANYFNGSAVVMDGGYLAL